MFHMPTLFSDNEECRPWIQYGVCKRPQKVICKWKNTQCNKRLEGLCAALSRKRSKRWNICGVWVPKVRKGASCKEWLFNLSERARTRINNCELKPEKVKQKWGSDLQQWGWFATGSIGFSLLMLPDTWTHFFKTFQPSICGNRAQGKCEGLLHEICHGGSGKVTKYSFWFCKFYLKI